MATHATVKAVVPTSVADAARTRAATEGKTLAHVIAELLHQYGTGKAKAKKRS